MPIVLRSRLIVVAAAMAWIGWGSMAHGDWAGCQVKPTHDCILEEALRGDSGPLTEKDRLDVLIQGGVLSHPEWATTSDIAEAQRMAQATPNITGLYYAWLAIQGLIAAKQKQQAIDLVASLPGTVQPSSISEIVKDLIKADDLQMALALPDRMQPPLDPKRLPLVRNDIVLAAVKALAEAGKTDGALMLIADQKHLPEEQLAELQTAVGLAFAKKGDANLAQATFDQAQKNLDAAQRYAGSGRAEMLVHLASIRLTALRGQASAVTDALRQFRSSFDGPAADPSTSYDRSQGYQRIVAALLDAKQPDAALVVAQSLTPDATKDAAVANVAVWDASNGRLAEARAVLSSMSTQETFGRTAVVRNIAVASAKAGDVASALKLVGEIKNPLNRRGALFLIAQTMPH